jgi:DNA-binding NtrC family response regulator
MVLLVWAPTGICEFQLPENATLQIGRSSSCGIGIPDPSVSRVHAEISVKSEVIFLTDLGSRNGSFVNDKRLSSEPVRLQMGDFLRFGSAEAQLQLSSRQFNRATDPLPEQSFMNRLVVEGERCVRFNTSLSVISLELAAEAQDQTLDLKRLVRESVRSTDIITSTSGRQFDALLPECGKRPATAAAQRIQASLEGLGIKARLGVAAFPGDAPSAESLPVAAQMAIRKVSGSGFAVANEATRVFQIGSKEILVADPVMLRLFGLVERIAGTSLPVLIHGETGSGKDIVAEAIHALGPRSAKPMVRLNCAAVPENLLESELFGYERGAFSGASASKAGLLEQASGGTLFLDEIGEMPLNLQAKLLRALEEQRIRRLGAVKDTPVDLRIVTATNRKLEENVKAGAFREDLFYRLNAFTLEVPPLRARPGEIALLAARFAGEECRLAGRSPVTISSDALEALTAHDWPGNVRQLRNVIGRAAVLSESEIGLEHLPPEIAEPIAKLKAPVVAEKSGDYTSLKEQFRDAERKRILDALKAANGNQTKAAKSLNMPRRTLVSKMGAMGIDGPRVRRSKARLTS